MKAKKKDNFKDIITVAALGLGAYFLLSPKGDGSGSEGGSFVAPLVFTPSGEQGLPGSIGSGSSGSSTKKEISMSGFPSNFFETTFQSSYPVVMYDPNKGGDQLYVQSTIKKLSAIQTSTVGLGPFNNPATGGLSPVKVESKKVQNILKTNPGSNLAPTYGSGF